MLSNLSKIVHAMRLRDASNSSSPRPSPNNRHTGGSRAALTLFKNLKINRN